MAGGMFQVCLQRSRERANGVTTVTPSDRRDVLRSLSGSRRMGEDQLVLLAGVSFVSRILRVSFRSLQRTVSDLLSSFFAVL